MATVEVVQRTGLIDLPISQLTLDPDVQCRESIDVRTVTEYKEHLASGGKFPASVVFYDGKIYWVADGFHRDAAYRASGVTECPCDVRSGTKRDAILYAVGANAAHGLPRSNKDKRRAVETLLKDPEWRQWSDREIAKRAGVTHPFVASVRPAPLETVTSQPEPVRKCADGRTINTANIGKTKPIEKAAPEPEKVVEPEPEPVSEARPVGLVAIADCEPEDTEDDEEECVAEVPREDLTETKEANDAIRIARTAVDAVWNKCPPSSRWRLKASIENRLAELTEEG